MGMMVDGEWVAREWDVDAMGAYKRHVTSFSDRVTADDSSGFRAEAGR